MTMTVISVLTLLVRVVSVKYKTAWSVIDTIDKASIMEKYMVEFLEGTTSITPVYRHGWHCTSPNKVVDTYLDKLNELRRVGEHNTTKTSQKWHLKRFFSGLIALIIFSNCFKADTDSSFDVTNKIIEIYELSEYVEANKNEV